MVFVFPKIGGEKDKLIRQCHAMSSGAVDSGAVKNRIREVMGYQHSFFGKLIPLYKRAFCKL